MSQLSSFSASSVRDLLPDSCCLNIFDDDEGTLSLVTRFTDSYLSHSTTENVNFPDSDHSDSELSIQSRPTTPKPRSPLIYDLKIRY